jgi:DNA gyrase subunit A
MADQDNGTNGVATVELHEEMEDSFMQFALSVIVGRALPDARDGLKPSQRRILLAMYDDGVTATGRHVKCASIVGETIKTYHPHGDLALYQTLVRMAQDFSLRYPLIDPQGNFGSIDGDPAGAARYTEARLSHIAAAMLEDLDKDTVDWQPNYDERSEEPEVLPAGFPNLVCNGVTGIAVGYATNMPPHNLGEVVEAACALMDKPDLEPRDMMRYIEGPDFPTGGLILGRKGTHDYMTKGKGSVIMQARAVVEELPRGRKAIIVTELPYQVAKGDLITQIAKLVNDGKIKDISDIRDESDRNGMRMLIELKRDANAEVVLQADAVAHQFPREPAGADQGRRRADPAPVYAQGLAGRVPGPPARGHHPPRPVSSGPGRGPRPHRRGSAPRSGFH